MRFPKFGASVQFYSCLRIIWLIHNNYKPTYKICRTIPACFDEIFHWRNKIWFWTEMYSSIKYTLNEPKFVLTELFLVYIIIITVNNQTDFEIIKLTNRYIIQHKNTVNQMNIRLNLNKFKCGKKTSYFITIPKFFVKSVYSLIS